ncbi:hypothetical protein LRP49_20140 [Enterovibrio sp. ZSDZ35]|uniref:Uncharacterized protein n=1 Tax=Enterovibrio qingdaonensis TaxID=2899818 RepID=A0ABT5QR79_9GAMM|nr:hypothetical protein [Enterovibrio sp. ZSDZ35]MDD1783488.1 hypothetical protein [Enterovibrio sp. ZSDZ35]
MMRKKATEKKATSPITKLIATGMYITTLFVIVLFWVNNVMEHWLK